MTTNLDLVSTLWTQKTWKVPRGVAICTSTNWTALKGMYDLDNVLDELYDQDNVPDKLYDPDNVLDELYDLDNVLDNIYLSVIIFSVLLSVQSLHLFLVHRRLEPQLLKVQLDSRTTCYIKAISTVFLQVLRDGRPTCLIKASTLLLLVMTTPIWLQVPLYWKEWPHLLP